ncbi:MAG: hypothetical protein ACRCT1_11625 [Microcoleaceae cyanobacterium]
MISETTGAGGKEDFEAHAIVLRATKITKITQIILRIFHKKEEGRRKKEEGRGKKEEGGRKKEEGRRRKEDNIQETGFLSGKI